MKQTGLQSQSQKTHLEKKIEWLVAHEEIQKEAETITTLCPCSPAGYDRHCLEAEPSKPDTE